MTMDDRPEPSSTAYSPSRRELVRVLAGTASLLGISATPGCGAREPGEASRVTDLQELRPPDSRIAVVGGGIGGVACAYLCGPSHRVDLFEARPKIGGHCDTIEVDVPEGKLAIDLGAQFFHPDTHPLYVSLLSELGLYSDDGRTPSFAVEGSLSVFPTAGGRPYFVSTQPLSSPRWAIDFALFTRCARRLVEENGSWATTVAEWVRGIPVSRSFKESVLLPWIAALIGCGADQILGCSARAIAQTFALSFPRNVLRKATTWNSTVGLGGFIDALAGASAHLEVHPGRPVERLEESDGKWFLGAGGERHGPYDAVVMNAMPHASKGLIAQLPWAGGLRDILERYEYFDTKLTIHRDPVYMPQNRRDWAIYNAGVATGVSCEGSIWLGSIHSRGQVEAMPLFKSWAHRRSVEPKEVLAERRFRHALITPRVIEATRRLKAWQGVKGLWFSGQHATGMDLQEAGVFTALRVAAKLSPASVTLRSLQKRLARSGLSRVSYDP